MDGDPYSPRKAKLHASLKDTAGNVLSEDENTTPVGYGWLHTFCASKAVNPRHLTFVSTKFSPGRVYYSAQNVVCSDEIIPIDTVIGNILWALEYEGFELRILKMVILNAKEVIVSEMRRLNKSIRYSPWFRRVWTLVELWTDMVIDISNCSVSLKPVLLLDPEAYVCGPCWSNNERTRVFNNLLGTNSFHPFARKSLLGTTSSIKHLLENRTLELTADVRLRAASYMRYKETHCSFEIEQEQNKFSEIKTWCKLLRHVKSLPLNSTKGTLSVTSSLFPDNKSEYATWREEEIFIGQTRAARKGTTSERIFHIGAKAADLNEIMRGFYSTMNDSIAFASQDFSKSHCLLRCNHNCFDPVSIIALLSFSFTIIHPLPDGNGRTHRLLIHYLLEKFGILDSWLVPVSVIILHDNLRTGAKEKVLQEISEPIIRRTRFHLKLMAVWPSKT